MIKMVSQLADECLYEVYIDEVVVWRRVLKVEPRNYQARVATAREQESVAGRLARAKDPWAELRLITGSVAGSLR